MIFNFLRFRNNEGQRSCITLVVVGGSDSDEQNLLIPEPVEGGQMLETGASPCENQKYRKAAWTFLSD